MNISIVTTTINIPKFFSDYCQDIILQKKHNVSFVVIGDKKTPLEVNDYCKNLQEKYNLQVEYYDVSCQLK